MTQAQLALVPRDGAPRRDGARSRRAPSSTRTWRRGQPPPIRWRRSLPIGYVRSLEGADSHGDARHTSSVRGATACARSVRRTTARAPTRRARTPPAASATSGRSLLAEMDRLGFILDATHLCDDSFWEALDAFGGRVWASHNNCRALVPHNRQFSDDQIRALVARGAVIGVALDAWMLVPGLAARRDDAGAHGRDAAARWSITSTTSATSRATRATSASAAISTAPSAASRQPRTWRPSPIWRRIPALLAERGYAPGDIQNIAHGNFIGFLRRVWA